MIPNSRIMPASFLKQSHAVYTLIQAELSRLCCPICDGIVFQPFQCANCQKVYCGPHVKQSMKCVICRHSKWRSTSEIDKYHRMALLGIKMRCDCTSELFRYTEYIQHLPECQQESLSLGHNYRCFYSLKNGQINPLTELQNMIFNINLNHQKKQFQLDMFTYDLINLKRRIFCHKTNSTLEQKIQYKRHQNHRRFVVWCVSLPDNQFTPYDNQNQKVIQKAYKQYNKDSEKSQITIKVQGQQKLINFPAMIQVNLQTSFSRGISRQIL